MLKRVRVNRESMNASVVNVRILFHEHGFKEFFAFLLRIETARASHLPHPLLVFYFCNNTVPEVNPTGIHVIPNRHVRTEGQAHFSLPQEE